MASKQLQMAKHRWLSLFIVMLAIPIAQVLVGVVVIGLSKQPLDAPITQFVVATLAHLLVLFVLVPFVVGLPAGTRSFRAYVDAIRLSSLRPFLRLLLLGLSCYLILALCQASGVMVYRASEGKAVTWSFDGGSLPGQSVRRIAHIILAGLCVHSDSGDLWDSLFLWACSDHADPVGFLVHRPTAGC